MTALRQAGRAVPAEVSLVTDYPSLDSNDVTITAVRMPLTQLSSVAADVLAVRAEGGALRDRVIEHAPQLMPPASTRPRTP